MQQLLSFALSLCASSSRFYNECVCSFLSLPDISPLVEKIDDPSMANDKDLLQVVRLLDDACKEAGFFYVVITR